MRVGPVEYNKIDSVDPRLDWAPAHDDRSRNYPYITSGVQAAEVERSWTLGAVLDQGREGACVGFGWTAEFLASPRPDYGTTATVGNGYAKSIYYRAKEIDEWPGEDYSGTSVLAGAKVAVERKHIESYRWCFSVEDLRSAVINEGPVVIGIPWYSKMYQTRPSGLVDVEGTLVGGHCILVYGYHPRMRISGEGWFARHRVFKWRNSWGPGYGINGNGLVRYEDMELLLSGWGEACVPMTRNMIRLFNGTQA